MKFAFEDKKIRTFCEDADKANAEFGHAVAQNLQSRLADLDAATTIKDVMTGQPEKIKDSLNYKVDLGDGFRLVFCCNHINPPLLNGKIDWEQVTYIRLLQIEKINE